MKRRPTTRRAIAELLALWVGTTLAMAALFAVYNLANAEPSRAEPACIHHVPERHVNPEITWEAWLRAQRAAGFRPTGRWLASGEPELIRIH